MTTAVGIVGIACRVPGANDPATFWERLCLGVDAVTDFTDDELLAAGVPRERFERADYVRSRGAITGIDRFDGEFFGYSPHESALMDPQQRLFLESAWHALEDAGCRPGDPSERVGVFAGSGLNSYLLNNLSADRDLIASTDYHQLLLAGEKDFLATRVSYKLDLTGPGITVATACSTSLVAVHLACASILRGECDVAVAGGVSVQVPFDEGFVINDDGILSPDGRSRAFSANANGIGAGSGVAIVVLQRPQLALERGRRIYALVRGSAINNDGAARAGFTAPSVQGQASVIGAALAAADVDASTIGYLEAHGTGTPLGDPIEVAALTKAFRANGASENGRCALGSVKSNLGHLDAAAGAIGLIKAALALHHGALPPTLHADVANPAIDFAHSPFMLNTQLRAWPRSGAPRRAGVSSFGLGGTNAHAVLEEAPLPAPESPERPFNVVTLSAKSADARDAAAERLTAHLVAHPEESAADAAFTLATRKPFAHRRAVVWSSDGHAVASVSGDAPETPPRIAFLFPGGGSEYANMAAGLAETEPVFRAEFERCAAILREAHGVDLRADAGLHVPRYAFPAIFAVECALVKLWASWGVRPDAMLGHSLGEYAAAYVAGVFSLEDALALVALRGELFDRTPPGAMLRVRLSEDDLRARLGGKLSIAAINGPATCVVSGPLAEIDRFESDLRAGAIDCRRVKLAAAAHSVLVEPLLDDFARFLDGVDFHPPELPWISNVSGTWITPEEAMSPGYWCRHFRRPVRFSHGLAELFAQPDCVLLEVGPGRTLASLALAHPARTPSHAVLTSMGYREESQHDAVALLTAAGSLWTAGVDVESQAFHGGGTRRIVSLPGYPFDGRRHWIDAPRVRGNVMSTNGRAPSAPSSLDRLKEIVSAVSGIPPADVDASQTFFEIGLDSLALIQVNAALKKQLGVSLGLGELLDELSRIDVLAAHIDTLVQSEAPEAPAPVRSEAIVQAPVVAPAVMQPSSGLEAVIAQQLEIMRTQLELMRGGQGIAPPAPAPVAAAPVNVTAPKKKPLSFASAPSASAPELRGPQARHLAKLIERYTAKTAGSKAYAGRYRDVLADSRAAVGFRLALKEMQYPIVGERADGAYFWDLDGNKYVDLTNGFGVTFFGHHPPYLERAFAEYSGREILFGPRSPLVGEVSELISEMTGMERVAFCNSGTEAVMAAIRLARTRTGRPRIVTFEGAYHGHSDQTLAQSSWRDGEPFAEPIAPGIPPEAVAATVVLEYGSAASLDYIRKHAAELAAVLVEPIQNMRLAFQPVEFLRELRAITERAGTALIFDEMITGFRLHPAGAQGYYGITADIATYGKLIGGGMPIGVVAGKPAYMDGIDGGTWRYGDASSPQASRTFFGGTFCQHPLTMIAAAATLRELKAAGPQLQIELNRRTADFAANLNGYFERNELPMSVAHFGSAFRMSVPSNLDLLFYHLIARGVYVWEWRGCFLSTAHTDADLRFVSHAIAESVDALREGEYLPARSVAKPAAAATVPLTRAQRQLWALAQLHPAGALAYKMGLAVRVAGPLDRERLTAAVDTVVARHDALRTVFAPDGETQTVLPALAPGGAFVDLSAFAPDERERRAAEWFEAKNSAPLALDGGPLFACDVLRFSAEDHAIVLTAHHAISDGWSLTNLVGELMDAYAGRTLAPAMQYGAYVDWQRSFSRTEEYARQEAFWLARFGSDVPVLELPLDRARPAERTYRAERSSLVLTPGLTQRIKRFCAQQRCTLFIGLYAAYAALLHRWTSQDEVLVAISASGRGLDGSESLFGYCTHMLPIVTRIEPGASFAEHLAETKKILGEAYGHADYPFADLLERLALGRDRSHAPLVSASFNLDRPGSLPPVDGLRFDLYPHPVHFSDIDLMVNVIELGDTLVLDCDFNADILDAASAERLLIAYRTLLEAIVDEPNGPVTRLPILPPAERAAVVRNGVSPAAVPFVALHASIAARAAERPDAIAVECASESLTYRELDTRANRLARYLQRKGAGPDGLVAVMLEASIDLVVAVLAVLKTGAAYVPIDPANAPERIAFMLDDAKTAVAITGRLLESERAAIAAESGDDLNVPVASSDLAYVIYTSGTSGMPKGVQVEHGSVARLFTSTAADFHFGPSDVWTLFHSASFDFSVWELFGALAHGGRLVVVPHWVARDSAAFLQLLSDRGVTVLNQTPSAFRQLMAAETAARPKLPLALRTIVFGGEALEIETLRPWFAEHGDRKPQLVNMYGITETTVHATYRVLSVDDLDLHGSRIGRPLADLHAYVLDAEMQPVPRGVAGEIYIGGPGVARGYLNRPELTRERFMASPFRDGERLYRSGDRARWTNGGELEYLGRADDQVKIRGYRIELGEIESVLRAHPQVRDAVVIARKPPGANALQLTAYIVGDSGEVPASALREFLSAKLPDYMVPSSFVPLTAVPLTRNGKVDRSALPEPDARSRGGVAHDAPRTAAEERIAGIWADVLGRTPGIHENFFEAGGDSIVSMQISARAKAAGIALSVRDVHRHPTIAAQAQLAGALPDAAAAAAETPSLLPAQHWFFAQQQPEPNHHNMALMLDLAPDAAPDRIERALQSVADHHPALRTGFRRGATGWEAFLAPAGGRVNLERHTAVNGDVARIEAAVQASIVLSEPPLWRAVLFDRGGGRTSQLLLVFHHAIADGVSLRIVLDDLERAYRGELTGAPASPFAWAHALERAVAAGTFDDERPHWSSLTGGTSLRRNVTASAGDLVADEAHAVVRLDRSETAAVLRSQPEDAVLAAVTGALGEWLGDGRILIDVESHGREDVLGDADPSAAVGWFTSIAPIEVELRASRDALATLRAVQSARARTPRNGLGYFALRAHGALDAIPQAEVLFNYLGAFRASSRDGFVSGIAPERAVNERSPRNRRTHALEVNAFVVDECLEIDIAYAGGAFAAATIDGVAAACREMLRELPNAKATPDTDLDADRLQRVLSALGAD